MSIRLAGLLVIATAVLLASRAFGPSDLYDQDQPKTVAYTVDIVEHGRWVLPRDMLGRPSTKPPMYNWIGAPLVMIFGTSEFVLKLPSVLGGLAVLALTVIMGRRTAAWLPRRERRWNVDDASGARAGRADVSWEVALAAGVIWLACYPSMKLMYTARPDMLLTALLIGAWVLGTLLLEGLGVALSRHRRWWLLATGFWLCVAGAWLTKGIPALLPIIYVVLAARLRQGRWGAVKRTGILWGLPLAIGIVSVWATAAYRIDPAHFEKTFVGYETFGRIFGMDRIDAGVGVEGVADENTRGGPMRIVTDAWKMPAWFAVRFVPWSLIVVLAMVHVPWRRWLSHAMGPAILWIMLVLVFFSLSAGKRADYLAPAYPAGAILAAYWLVVVAARHGVTAVRAATAGLIVLAGVAAWQLLDSPAARSGTGQRIAEFADIASGYAGEQGVVFDRVGYNPLPTLMGVNQATDVPTEEMRRAGGWLIRPIGDGEFPIVASMPMPTGRTGNRMTRMGLFRLSEGREIGTRTQPVPPPDDSRDPSE